jgi:hypothetical protein
VANLATIDDYINRASNGYITHRHYSVQIDAATSTSISAGQLMSMQLLPVVQTIESMPSGVTGYRLVNATLVSSLATGIYSLVKLINLGSVTDLSSFSFTDGSAMPSITEGNNSNASYSPILMQITGTLNSAPGTFTITYVDQDGNTAEAAPGFAPSLSCLVGTTGPVPLNTGDIGARDVTNITRSGGSAHSGSIRLWGAINLGMFGNSNGNINQTYQLNFLTGTPSAPLLSAGDQLGILALGTVTAKAVKGSFTFIGEQA